MKGLRRLIKWIDLILYSDGELDENKKKFKGKVVFKILVNMGIKIFKLVKLKMFILVKIVISKNKFMM